MFDVTLQGMSQRTGGLRLGHIGQVVSDYINITQGFEIPSI